MTQVTKGEIVEGSLQIAGMAGEVLNPSAEVRNQALTLLELMVRAWEREGIFIGFSLSPNPYQADPAEEAMVSDTALDALQVNLAVKVMRNFSRPVIMDLLAEAGRLKSSLYCTEIPEIPQNPYQPAGAGMCVGSYFMPDCNKHDCCDDPFHDEC